jgi:hypothetical protein
VKDFDRFDSGGSFSQVVSNLLFFFPVLYSFASCC